MFVVAGLLSLGFYLTAGRHPALLIPSYVMFCIAGIVAVATYGLLDGGMIATFVLSLVGIPFLVTFLTNMKQNWWALIPAYVLFVVGVMVALIETNVLTDLLIPSYVNFAVAIPFFVVYLVNRKNWWALIPGGIMAAIASAFLIAESMIQYVVPVILIVIGIVLLFRPIGKGSQEKGEGSLTGPEADKAPEFTEKAQMG
jgi:hypothetical protein